MVVQGTSMVEIANDHRIEISGGNTCRNIEWPLVDACSKLDKRVDLMRWNGMALKLASLSDSPLKETSFLKRDVKGR